MHLKHTYINQKLKNIHTRIVYPRFFKLFSPWHACTPYMQIQKLLVNAVPKERTLNPLIGCMQRFVTNGVQCPLWKSCQELQG